MTAPRIPEGSPDSLVLSSPLAVLGMFVTVIRERFSERNSSDPAFFWTWNEDPKTTGIFVESGWNENLEARTVRPGIWIDRGQNAYRQSSIGRQDQMPLQVHQQREYSHSFVETDIMIDCTARKRGESMLLGSIVQDFIEASSDIIEAKFGLRHISDSILNQTAPFEKDDVLWNSQLSFRVFYEVRWITAPIQDLLNKISLRIEDSDNPDNFFTEIILRNKEP